MLNALITNDQPYCCEIPAALLESDCPDVEVIRICGNGSEGLTIIKRKSPDLVFPDGAMPKMNGFEMLDMLRLTLISL
jgi:two-component system, LytTR family, response regulator